MGANTLGDHLDQGKEETRGLEAVSQACWLFTCDSARIFKLALRKQDSVKVVFHWCVETRLQEVLPSDLDSLKEESIPTLPEGEVSHS